MKADCHVRFRKNTGVKFPCMTRLCATDAAQWADNSRLREFIEEKEFWNNVTEYVQQKMIISR